MIVSASRRTDIPACFAPWLARRLREGYALVRHPYDPHQVTRVMLTPDAVDGLVLWTKHAVPLMPYVDALGGYTYYFQYTVTPYGGALEPGLPDVWTERIPAVLRLSDAVGPERIVWRYDPVILTDVYTVSWHAVTFGRMAALLAGRVRKCTFSFVDDYASTARNMAGTGMRRIAAEDMRALAAAFAEVAAQHGLALDTCCEAIDLTQYGIGHASCVDRRILEELGGWPLRDAPAKGQRSGCGCMQSVDIGMYGTCVNGCRYCYANADTASARRLYAQHDPASPLLIGRLSPEDTVRDTAAESLRIGQLSMF